MIMKLLLVALAGGLGTLSRYGLSGIVQRSSSGSFPWGTLVVNITGCLMFGVVWAIVENRFQISSDIRTIVLVGFMGAFTTFSTFVFETQALLQDSEWLLAATNMLAQNISGVLFLIAGLMIGKLV
ncbi:CrcB family protein [bacterium]|nr:CrcB family protein [bacterium]